MAAVSGPVTSGDADAARDRSEPAARRIEITESGRAEVGLFTVRRALPRRDRRTVGAWCFVDHMGPTTVIETEGLDIGPHPHIGLQTVTWLLEGEALHRDSLGSEQLLRPGQLNLMTAGNGVSHSEEATGTYRGDLHGVQLWIAQPEATRHGAPAFEHHGALPRTDIGAATLTVLVGELDGVASPARRDTDHLGVDLDLRAGVTTIPMRPDFEYAVVVFDGEVTVDRHPIVPGHLAYLGTGRDELELTAERRARALLVGGTPFPEPILMWWNYVAREREEISQAHRDWMGEHPRYGSVASPLERVTTGAPPWVHGSGDPAGRARG